MSRLRHVVVAGLAAGVVVFGGPLSPLEANTDAPDLFTDVTDTALPQVEQESTQGLWQHWRDTDNDGLTDLRLSYSINWGDADGDGFVDLYVNNHLGDNFGPPPTLYINQGDGTFKNELDRIEEGPHGQIVNGDRHGAAWVDIDNDGDKDLLQLVGLSQELERSRNKLLINEDGQFTNEAAERGIGYAGSRAREITLFDMDDDGRLDFLHGSLTDGVRPVELPPTIFTQNQDGTFADSGASLNHDYQRSYGLEYGILADLDLDGSPELVQKQPFQVFDTSESTLQDITNSIFTGVSDENSRGLIGMEIADFNGDTVPDFFFPGWVTSNHQLILSSPNGWFDASAASNIRGLNFQTPDGSGVVSGDFDNDTDIDMIVLDRTSGGLDYLLTNDGSGVFTSEPFTLTQRFVTSTHRSVASADYNNDGALDVTETTDRNDPTYRLLENNGNDNNWFGVVLQGTESNRDGIGATVLVTTGGTTQARFQRAGLNFRVQSDSRLHFGLGDAASIDEVRIIWPSGEVQVLNDVSPNQYLEFIETSDGVAPEPDPEPQPDPDPHTDPDPTTPPVDGRVTDNLIGLWTFDAGSGGTTFDTSGYLEPLDLSIGNVGGVSWGDGTLSLNSPTLISSGAPASKLSEAIVSSQELTIEAWVSPSNLDQVGPARIATLSSNPTNRNLTLGQQGGEFEVRLRTTTTGTNGVGQTVGTTSDAVSTSLSHVVYTRDSAGTARLYVDGVAVATETIGGSLNNWDPNYAFALGAELTGERSFLGLYDLVAIYDAALTGNEVTQNFNRGSQPELLATGPQCYGLDVTVDLAAGDSPTAGDDVILGTPADDLIVALEGNDIICGEGGNDTINAGPGNDTVLASDGDDTVFGLDGDDIVHAGAGNDQVIGGDGNDSIEGGDGLDVVNGGPGNDFLDGGADRDLLFAQAGDDTVDGGDGDDFVLGGSGIDTIDAGSGDDAVNAGPGDDTVDGSGGNDTIIGLTGIDTLNGDDGSDRIFGGPGNDIIDGGTGNDQLLGNEGNDTLTDPSGANTLNGGFGNDTITGGADTDTIFGDADNTQAGSDVLDGGGGNDLIIAFAGDDTITANDGESDTVNGGPGIDACAADTGVISDIVFNCEP